MQAIEDEVNFYKDRAKEFTHFRELCYLAYDLELSDYKRRISETESAYETSMELVDNEIKVTRNKLSKAVDDLKFYREQIPMFHRKIAEVQEIFAQREEANKPPVSAGNLIYKQHMLILYIYYFLGGRGTRCSSAER